MLSIQTILSTHTQTHTRINNVDVNHDQNRTIYLSTLPCYVFKWMGKKTIQEK